MSRNGTQSGAAEQACDLLYAHWSKGSVIEALPEDLRPPDRAGAYRIQQAILRHSVQPQTGWKIGATSKAGQAHINVDGPIFGRLLAERQVANGGSTPFGANRMRVIEAEFAFRMGRTLQPRAGLYAMDEVLESVESLHPSIEIPDSRYRVFTAVGPDQLIADNSCAHRFVIGSAAPDAWRRLDLAAHKVVATINDTQHFHGIGANVLGDPRLALVFLANELSQYGYPLEAGQMVMTGTCVTPVAVDENDHVLVDFGALGTASVRFSDRGDQ